MIPDTVMEQIENGEFPDNLQYAGEWQTFSTSEARDLDVPDEIWEEALNWAGIANVIQEPGYDYHIPSMGKKEQDACIDFTAGISPTGDIIFEAVMYKAEITRKLSVTYRDQRMCAAFIIWKPEDQFTKAVFTKFLQQNR